MPGTGRVKSIDKRNDEQNRDADDPGSQLQKGINAEGMPPCRIIRGKARLPRHIPPMKVPSNTPRDTAVEPITSCSNWNQTISYINAEQPLPTNNSNIKGRKRPEPEELVACVGFCADMSLKAFPSRSCSAYTPTIFSKMINILVI